MKHYLTADKRLPIAAFILLAAIICIDALSQFYLKSLHLQSQEDAVFLHIAALRYQIERDITGNLLLIQGTANFISATDNLTDDTFNRYAAEALTGSKVLKNLAAAPDFTIQFVYPRLGNEKILGVNYLNIPSQWALAEKAYATRKLVVAGPLNLIQGGTGLIARAPVFKKVNGNEAFWGIVSAVIDMDVLVKHLGLSAYEDIAIAIRGKDGLGAHGEVFMGNATLFDPENSPILMPVEFPAGSWQIAATPKSGWKTTPPLAPLLHAIFILMAVGIVITTHRAMKKSYELSRTQHLLNEAQKAAHLGNWEYDVRTGKLWWSDEVYHIFGLDKATIAPSMTSFIDLIHPDDREFVKKSYAESLEHHTSFALDHRIVRPDGMVRFVQGTTKTYFDRDVEAQRSVGTIQDITDRKRIEFSLIAEQGKLRAMAEASYDAYIMIDKDDTILFWSPAAEKLFGWTALEALGQKMHPLITPEEYHEAAIAGLKQFAHTGKGAVMNSVMEFIAIRKDGTHFPVERSVSSFKNEDEYYAVGQLRDITKRKLAEEELERLATTDSMTGLNNRGYFMTLAKSEIDKSRRYGRDLSLLMLDADEFKHINDTYGHSVGDKVLQSLAATMRSTLREVDITARIGGEEFVALLPETSLENAIALATRLRENIAAQTVSLANGNLIHCTVSIGVTAFLDKDSGIEAMLKLADEALYTAKKEGRNCVRVKAAEHIMPVADA